LGFATAASPRFVDCTFRDNGRNFSLWYGGNRVSLLDCVVEPGKFEDALKPARRGGKAARPAPQILSEQHVIVEVRAKAGAPVTGAQVEVVCEQGPTDVVEFGRRLTNADGRTPGKGRLNAILVRDFLKQAADDPLKPVVEQYTYEIRVKADGFAPVSVTGFRPDAPWKVCTVALVDTAGGDGGTEASGYSSPDSGPARPVAGSGRTSSDRGTARE